MLAERLFGYQYAVEMHLPAGQRSIAWVKRLSNVVGALKNEVASLIGKKPAVTIKAKAVTSKHTKYSRPVGLKEKKLPPLVNVRYLYQPDELEGGTKRATDPIWSLKVHQIKNMWPNRVSLSYIICLTGLSAALFVKSCWLFHQTHSYRLHNIFMPVC